MTPGVRISSVVTAQENLKFGEKILHFFSEKLSFTKVPILKEVNFGKMQLCQVEHFYNIFVLTFGRDC